MNEGKATRYRRLRRRAVLLADALLADYSDDEIEVVLAHELGHCVHLDLWKTIACEAAAVALACGAARLGLPSRKFQG